ncbi:MAG: hypothetical protein LBM07_03795 [Culturomica sp.]|jgi:hypothetical protein|nr:hypothetical protein [Culturomica sp.]
MNCKFEISTPESSGFRAEVAIKGTQTFLDFNNKLMEVLGYIDAQLSSFYTLDKSGIRGKEISLMDMATGEEDSDVVLMENTSIQDIINANCIELDYVYDFMNNKYLKIEYSGEYIADSADVLPVILSTIGEPPLVEDFKDWGFDEDGDEDYDDSFMDEFSDFTISSEDEESEDIYGEEEDYGGRGGYNDRYDNIDDYIDRM